MKKIIAYLTVLIIALYPVTVSAITEKEALQNEDIQYYRLNQDDDNSEKNKSDNESGLNKVQERVYFSAPPVVHNPDYASYDIYDGVDISSYQGTVDFNKVKADGIDFVIIRAGYRGYGSTGSLNTDSKFETYIKAAQAVGLEVGVYFFTQAVSVEEAEAEAQYVANLVSEYGITLPIAYDIENYPVSYGARLDVKLAEFTTTAQKKAFCTSLANAFCSKVESLGYQSMIYANKNWLTNYLDSETLSESYQIWLAHYITQTSYTGVYNFWQCTSESTVNGISTDADYDFYYARNPEKTKSVTAVSKTVSSMNLSWDKALYATNYRVSVYNSSGTLVHSQNTDSLNCTVTGLASGKSYKFDITPYYVFAGKSYYASSATSVTALVLSSQAQLNKTTMTLGSGESYTLTATTSGTALWKSNNTAIATISNTGKITAKAVGVTSVTVTDSLNGTTASCIVTVKKAPASVALNVTSKKMAVGQTLDLSSSVPSGTASYSRVYTSNNTTVASVTRSGGLITAKQAGNVTITVKTFNGKTATCKITVYNAAKISKSSITLGVMETNNLTANVAGTASWKSNNTAIVTVSNTGKITAKAVGVTSVVVMDSYTGSKASCMVTVKKAPSSVSLNVTSKKMAVGQTLDLSSSVPSGTASYSRVYTSNNTAVAPVTRSGGLITAKQAGSATITVKTFNGKTATCKVTVYNAAKISKSSITLGVGESYTLTATVAGTALWTSGNGQVVTVSSGKITARGVGTAAIIVEDSATGSLTNCTVTVKKAPSSVSLNVTSKNMYVGQTLDLSSSVPSGTASYSRAYTSNNTVVAPVTKSGGLITAKQAGSAIITVKTFNGKTATCKVTVYNVTQVSKSSITLGVGESHTLTATVAGTASWKSNNTAIATISKVGKITAKAVGTTSIVVKDSFSGKTAKCTVTVKRAPSSVSLNVKNKKMAVGQKLDLSSYVPSGTASYLRVYTSNNTAVAPVTRSGGLITAKRAGNATITVKTFNGKTATCKVAVY